MLLWVVGVWKDINLFPDLAKFEAKIWKKYFTCFYFVVVLLRWKSSVSYFLDVDSHIFIENSKYNGNLGEKMWKLAYGQNFHEYLLCEAVVKIWVNSFIHLEPTMCQSLF